MIATLRRLDDLERYWGFTWPGWAGIVSGCLTLYLAVRFSPLSFRPTVTITLFVCTLVGMVLCGVSGQALSPSRQLWAVAAYIASPKLIALGAKPDRRGLVLVASPDPDEALVDGDDMHDCAALDLHGYRRNANGTDRQLDGDSERRDEQGWDPDRAVRDLDAVDELEGARVDAVDGERPADDSADQRDARSGDLAGGDRQTTPEEGR